MALDIVGSIQNVGGSLTGNNVQVFTLTITNSEADVFVPNAFLEANELLFKDGDIVIVNYGFNESGTFKKSGTTGMYTLQFSYDSEGNPTQTAHAFSSNVSSLNVELAGFHNAWVSNTTTTIGSGKGWDSTGQFQISTSSTLTLDTTKSGALGLDTGSLAANTWYYSYVVADTSGTLPVTATFSLSPNAPTLTAASLAGYDVFRKVGFFQTSAGSNILTFFSSGAGKFRSYKWEVPMLVLAGGTATTLTAFNLAQGSSLAIIPEDNLVFYASVSFDAATAGDNVAIIPFNSTNTINVQTWNGVVAGEAQTHQGRFLSQLNGVVPAAKYINSAAACSTVIHLTDFEYTL